jgi:hypothetical protein
MIPGGTLRTTVGVVLVLAGTLGGVPVATGSPAGVGVVATAADTVTTDAANALSAATGGDDDNEAPLAEAGLDQQVSVNATVYLDATGSRDPDGTIQSYEWSIERPDGNHTSPACADCARTNFQVRMNGTYAVTVTVTDDDGATSSDTLYVQANAVEGPTVELSGPVTVSPGANATYTATATAGASPLTKIEWRRNRSELADRAIDGESATDELTVGLAPGNHSLTARVTSEMGRTDTATLLVTVQARPDRPCEGATWNETSSRWDTDPCDGDDGREEDCYDENSDRAKEWENRHPNKEFACHNDVWFGGQSPVIVNTDEDDDFTAKGVSATISEARNWTSHPDVSIGTDTGFKRLNFGTHEVWRKTRKRGHPWNDDPDEKPGDEPGDPPSDDPENGDPEDDPEGDCDKIPPRYRPPKCSGDG